MKKLKFIALATIMAVMFTSQAIAGPVYENMQTGTHTYTVGPSNGYLELTNNTGQNLQVNLIEATPYNGDGLWGEMCAYLGTMQTRQDIPGTGEVGCSTKLRNEVSYMPLYWGSSSGLAIYPGKKLSIQAGVFKTDGTKDWRTTITIEVATQTSGIMAWRLPYVDEIHETDGTEPCTSFDTWTHEATWNGSQWVSDWGLNYFWVGGVTVFACSPYLNGTEDPHEAGRYDRGLVDSATIYILNPNDTVKWSYYAQTINQRGVYTFTPQKIYPGEKLAAQACNSVYMSGGVWDWAAYLHVWGIPDPSILL